MAWNNAGKRRDGIIYAGKGLGRNCGESLGQAALGRNSPQTGHSFQTAYSQNALQHSPFPFPQANRDMPWNAGQRREEQQKITINERYWGTA